MCYTVLRVSLMGLLELGRVLSGLNQCNTKYWWHCSILTNALLWVGLNSTIGLNTINCTKSCTTYIMLIILPFSNVLIYFWVWEMYFIWPTKRLSSLQRKNELMTTRIYRITQNLQVRQANLLKLKSARHT